MSCPPVGVPCRSMMYTCRKSCFGYGSSAWLSFSLAAHYKKGAFSTVLLAASPVPPSGGGDVACDDVVGAELVRLSGIRAAEIVVAPGASVGTCNSCSEDLGKDVFTA